MNTNQAKNITQVSPDDVVEVEDLDDFVRHLSGWHASRVAQLQHMIQMPEGITMITGGEGTDQPEATVLMQGEMLAGFKAGVELALMQLGTLPFSAELTDDTEH